jgi:hypothetical protein
MGDATREMSPEPSLLHQPAVTRRLPAVCEVLRAISGVVGIVALLAIVAGIDLAGASHGLTAIRPTLTVDNLEPARTPATAPVTAHSSSATFVLYLVETQEQEQTAIWGEMEAASRSNGTHGRYHSVVSTDSALELAVKDVVNHSLVIGEPLQIEVVDMRYLDR